MLSRHPSSLQKSTNLQIYKSTKIQLGSRGEEGQVVIMLSGHPSSLKKCDRLVLFQFTTSIQFSNFSSRLVCRLLQYSLLTPCPNFCSDTYSNVCCFAQYEVVQKLSTSISLDERLFIFNFDRHLQQVTQFHILRKMKIHSSLLLLSTL